MLNLVKLSIKSLWRDLRSGEWFIVIIALLLSVTALTALDYYAERVTKALEQQSIKLLGGNIVVSSPESIPLDWLKKAKSLQLRSAIVLSYPSVITIKDKLHLVNLQAVSSDYPAIHTTPLLPQKGSAWVDSRLMKLHKLSAIDQITIGASKFSASKELTNDSDALNTGLLIAPRVMIRLDDVPNTKTVIPGSRVEYRLLLVGEKSSLLLFQKWIIPQLTNSQKIRDIQSEENNFKKDLGLIENYLQLAILMCLMFSGIAIMISINQYISRQRSHIALWRSLGATQTQITYLFLIKLSLIGIMTGVAGVLLGYVVQAQFSNLFTHYWQFNLPPASIKSAFLGFISSNILLFTFSYPVITQLPKTSPISLWKSENIKSGFRQNTYLIIALITFILFIGFYTYFSILTFLFMNLISVAVAILYALILIILKILSHATHHTNGSIRRGLSQLIQHADFVSVQFIGLTLIITLVTTLYLVKNNLVDQWKTNLPANTPNYFAINIAPEDLTGLKTLLSNNHIGTQGIYPMVRGRLVGLNDKPILTALPIQARGHNVLRRELNISWMEKIPISNKIIIGNTWDTIHPKTPVISVEKEMAEKLQLKIGDVLTFKIGDTTVSAKIINIRSVNWRSFQPNFYVIFSPGALDSFPTTYITSFYLSNNQTALLNDLAKSYPNITIIDVANVLKQVQEIIRNITLVAQILFMFMLADGILIFIASLQASHHQRKIEYTFFRTLGASRQFILSSLAVEFSVLFIFIIGMSMLLAKLFFYYLLQYLYYS